LTFETLINISNRAPSDGEMAEARFVFRLPESEFPTRADHRSASILRQMGVKPNP